MAAPTLIDYAESNWTDSSSNTDTTDDLNWDAAGDVIVVLGATEDNGLAMATPTGTGITLSALAGLPTNTGSSCKVYGWSATAAGDGNTTLTSSNPGSSGARGIAAWSFSGVSALGTPGVNVGSGLTVSLTVAADSTVVMVLADWNATADVTVDTTPAGGTIRQNNQVSGLATFLVIQWDNQAAGTRNYGVTNWTGTGTVSKAAVEIQGAGGTDHTRTVDDSTGLTDAAAAILSVTRSQTDSAGLVDAAAAVLSAARAQTDSAGLVDDVSQALFALITRTVGDDIGLADTDTDQAFDVADTLDDDLGLTDSTSVQLTSSGTSHTRTVDDAAGLVDAAAAVSAFTRTHADNAGLTDMTAAVVAFTRTVTDSAGLTDGTAVQLAGAGTRTVDDTTGLTDSLAIASAQTVTDDLGLTDTATPSLSAARSVGDSAGLTDAALAALSRAVTVTDSAGLTDAVTAELNAVTAHVRTITDSIGLTSAHRLVQTTHRPDIGVTARPNSGTTLRYALVPD